MNEINLTGKDTKAAFLAGYDFALVAISRSMNQVADWREKHPGDVLPESLINEVVRSMWAHLPEHEQQSN